jgi:hypothetical protein
VRSHTHRIRSHTPGRGWHRWREAVEAFPLQRVFLVCAGGLEARPASTVDTPDRRSSRNHAAPRTPGSGGSRTSFTAPPTRASPRSPVRLARPTAIGTQPSVERQQLLELSVLLLELPKAIYVNGFERPETLAPRVDRLLADAVLLRQTC